VTNFAIATVALALVGAAAPSDAQQATTKDQFVGTWKVDVLKTTVGDKVSHPLGDRPSGYVTLTADRIWLLFVDPARKPPATPALTDAEAAAMMKTQVSWTGRYVTGEQTPDGLKITSHVDAATSEALNGTDRVYLMRVEGNKLIMKSPGVIVPMTGATSIVDIELTKAQ
jgi:hypothetical protein